MLYLDNASTTKVLSEVFVAMSKCLQDVYGNPNSLYYEQAVQASKLVEQSREYVAQMFGANSRNVVFTGGATESNNMVIKGIALKNWERKGHIITSSVEHSSVIETCKYLESKGFSVTYLPVDHEGKVDLMDITKSIRTDTILVSIMWVNNETGVFNDIGQISEICEKSGVPFHTDATQAIGKMRIDLKELTKISFVSMSAHKIYGPKGVGCLVIQSNLDKLDPLIHGGEQERGLRGGTLSTHQIVGLGEAARIVSRDLTKNLKILKKLETKLREHLLKTYGDSIVIHSNTENKVPGIISVQFKGINNQLLLKSISEEIAASSGAACSSSKPSHVLAAMGYSDDIIKETIRLSLSPYDEYNDFIVFQ
jgi:cysteine desulfurase